MQVNIRRKIVVVTLMALVLLAVIYGFMPKPVPADVAKAERGSLRVTIEEEGKTRVKERFVISAPVSGYMRRVELDVGDQVSKGQTLVVLEPMRSTVLDPRSYAEARAAVSAAQAVLKSAEENARAAAADADYAKVRYERDKKLFEKGYIARDILDQAESEARRTEAYRLSAEASVKTAGSERWGCRHTLQQRVAIMGGRTCKTTLRACPRYTTRRGPVSTGEPLDIGDLQNLKSGQVLFGCSAYQGQHSSNLRTLGWRCPTWKKRGTCCVHQISSLGVEQGACHRRYHLSSRKLAEAQRRLQVEASIIWEGKTLQVPASALFERARAGGLNEGQEGPSADNPNRTQKWPCSRDYIRSFQR
jgi:HlyD family secretion protein